MMGSEARQQQPKSLHEDRLPFEPRARASHSCQLVRDVCISVIYGRLSGPRDQDVGDYSDAAVSLIITQLTNILSFAAVLVFLYVEIFCIYAALRCQVQ